jgi:type VI protein secretion system component VasK
MAEGEPTPKEILEPGDWALFRLVRRADTLVQNSATEIEVRWRLVYDDGGRSFAIHVPWTFRSESSVNPFTRDFFEFDCPRQLGPE